MVAYWFHLYPDANYSEHDRVVSLYCICHGYYEELCDHPDPDFPDMKLRPKMFFQIDFLNFYRFKQSASETLLDIHRSITGVISKKIVHYALQLCLAFYMRGTHLDQHTQDLLCLALLLRGVWHMFPDMEDGELWSVLSDTVLKKYERFWSLYGNEEGEWTLNYRQLDCITEYFYQLSNVDLEAEGKKWPIAEMIPKEMTLCLLPPKPMGCCTIHGHSYHEQALENIKSMCRKSGHGAGDIYRCKKGCAQLAAREIACLKKHWKPCVMCWPERLWWKACDQCRSYFTKLEDECFQNHGKLDPSKCSKGCSQRYSVGVFRMKSCKQKACRLLY